MPIAVVRQAVGAWPVTIRLDDSTSMAGQRISDFERVSIEVQVSGNGQPGERGGVEHGQPQSPWGRRNL